MAFENFETKKETHAQPEAGFEASEIITPQKQLEQLQKESEQAALPASADLKNVTERIAESADLPITEKNLDPQTANLIKKLKANDLEGIKDSNAKPADVMSAILENLDLD